MDTSLLLKYFSCKTSLEEEAAINAWLSDDPDGSHKKAYQDARFIFEGMAMHADKATPAVKSTPRFNFKKIAYAAMQVAAVALIVLGVSYATRNNVMDELSSRMRKISVPDGKNLQITLDDGTTLWLNAGTEIEYPIFFSRSERKVNVKSGEVLFEVSRDENRPFHVDTYAGRISVLGTKFNVEAYPEHNTFSTALINGSIKFTTANSKKDIELKPNDIVKIVDNRIYVGRLKDAGSVECWTDGLLDITGYPFEELMHKIEHAYDVTIRIERETMPEIRYSRGKIRISDGIEHAMSVLSKGSDFQYELDSESNTVTIK